MSVKPSVPSLHLNRLEQLLQKYDLGETLGTGAFSEVKTVTERRTGNKYAVKIIDKAKCKGKESMIETEVNILKNVKHEHIIQLYEMYEIEGKIYLIMELVTGGELFDDIVSRGKYSEADTAKIVHKILLAIDYLHSMGIVHRDLKPENLLLSDKSKQSKIMISDFGLSKIFNDDEVMKTACGTPGYVAPEVLIRKGYGREIDLWSMGVITYILLCGYPPFYDQNNVELFKQIMAGKYEFDRPWWDNISDKAKNFIRHLLVLDPRSRYTARQALEHPFITDYCGRSAPINLGTEVPLTRKRVPNPLANIAANAPRVQTQQQPHASSSSSSKSAPSTSVAITTAHPYSSSSAKYSEMEQVKSSSPTSSSSSSSSSPTTTSPSSTITSPISPPAYEEETVSPGRPIGQKSPIDDSGCVTSNDSIHRSSEHHNGGRDSTESSSSKRSNDCGDPAANHIAGSASMRGSPVLKSGPKSVRMLTYNIFLRPPGIRNNISDYKNARQAVFGDYCLKNYDIVALQEMFSYGSNRQSRMIQYAKKNGFEYYVSSPSKSVLNAQVDGGLMILSKYPIIKTDKMTYKRGVHSDRFSAKGALYAKIALTPQYCIHVFTTHLQSTYEKDVGIMDPSVVVRLNQIAMLKEFIDDCTRSKPAHEPIFLMGDMNTNGREASGSGKHSEEYNIMNKILQGEIAPSNIPSMGPTNSLSTTSNITASLSNLMSKTIRYQMHDLAYEAYGQHPVTYADVTDHSSKTPRETVLTAADDLGGCCSFDYIIWMNQAEHNAMNKDNFCTIKQNATKVDKFLIEGQPFTQISDHYGICTELNIH